MEVEINSPQSQTQNVVTTEVRKNKVSVYIGKELWLDVKTGK